MVCVSYVCSCVVMVLVLIGGMLNLVCRVWLRVWWCFMFSVVGFRFSDLVRW